MVTMVRLDRYSSTVLGCDRCPNSIDVELSFSSTALQVTDVRKHRSRRKSGLHVEHTPCNTVKSKSLWKQLLELPIRGRSALLL